MDHEGSCKRLGSVAADSVTRFRVVQATSLHFRFLLLLAANPHFLLVDGAKGGYDSRPRQFLAVRQDHRIVDFGVTFSVDRLALECAVVGARRIAGEVNAGGGALRHEARVGTGRAGRDGKSACLTSSSIGWGDERE